MKYLLILILRITIVFNVSTPVFADVLRLSPGIVISDLTVKGNAGVLDDEPKPLTLFLVDGEIGLFFLRPGMQIGYGQSDSSRLKIIFPRISYDHRVSGIIGISEIKVRVFEGFITQKLINDNLLENHDLSGFVLGIGCDLKFSEMFALTGQTIIPQWGAYTKNEQKHQSINASLRQYTFAARFSPIPLYDLLIGYHQSGGVSFNNIFNLNLSGIYLGYRISF